MQIVNYTAEVKNLVVNKTNKAGATTATLPTIKAYAAATGLKGKELNRSFDRVKRAFYAEQGGFVARIATEFGAKRVTVTKTGWNIAIARPVSKAAAIKAKIEALQAEMEEAELEESAIDA